MMFSFGVLGDTQYVDMDDCYNFDKTMLRRYRQSLRILFEASDTFIKHNTAFNVILGDVLDGFAKKLDIVDKCWNDILSATRSKGGDWHFPLGNHDYYCFSREDLITNVIPPLHRCEVKRDALYYSFSPHPGFTFVVLDGYDISVIGSSSDDHHSTATEYLSVNPNIVAGRDDFFHELEEDLHRYVPYNGAIGQQQLKWLHNTLQASMEKNHKCIVLCHMPVYRPASSAKNLLWNAEEVLSLLQRYPNVVAYLAGHDHTGGYACDTAGIHHIVPPAPLECAEGEVAYGRMNVTEDRLELIWRGRLPRQGEWPTSFPFR